MSYPVYNPYTSGNKGSNQGQYGPPGAQAERDPRLTPHLRPESSFIPPGASSTTPTNTGMAPSLLPHGVNYKPERSHAGIDEDMERSIDLQLSRAREQAMRQPVGMSPRFTGPPRDDCHPAGTSYPMPPGPRGQRPPDVESNSGSLDWLPNYNRTTGENVSNYYPATASTSYPNSVDGRFNASSERRCDTKSFPGLGEYKYAAEDKPPVTAEPSRPKYNSESAANILLHFGLEKEDLEHLIAYPEDQITPENLPFILRQIRIQKNKRTSAAVQPKPYSESQPSAGVSGMDRLSHSGGTVMHQDEIASSVLQPSKVIDYGHTGKYTGGLVDDIGRVSGSRSSSGGSASMVPMDTSNRDREPLQKSTAGMDFSAMVSPRDQGSSVANLSSSYSSGRSAMAAPSADAPKHVQTQPNQSSQSIFTTFSLPSKDTDSRPFASEFSKPPSLKPLDPKLPSKTQPVQSRTAVSSMPPGQRGMVLFDSHKDQSKTKTLSVPEKTKKQPAQEKVKSQEQLQQPAKQPTQTPVQNQPASQMKQAPVLSSLKLAPPLGFVPSVPNPLHPVLLPPVVSNNPRAVAIPPVQPPLLPAPVNQIPVHQSSSAGQRPASDVPKNLPSAELMHDYAATTPRKFPHTCSLCNKECSLLKDWISHQNTGLHLENCRYLRTRYPEWDGEVVKLPSKSSKDANPSPSTSSQPRHQKDKRQSRSSSPSPRRRRHSSERRRERDRPSSRSRSRSRSRSYSPRRRRGSSDRRDRARYSSWSRSRSRSPHGYRGSDGRRDRRSTKSRSYSPLWHHGSDSWRDQRDRRSRSPQTSRRACRSRSPSYSVRHDRPRASRHRSRSRSYRRESPPRRREDRRSPSRRSRERRSSSERSRSHQKKSSSAERLAKKLLATSAVQSLSSQTDIATVIKKLTPAILAELTKKSSPSTSASPSSRPATAKKKSTAQKESSSSKAKAKSSPAHEVKLHGVNPIHSYSEFKLALSQFGETESVVLFRSTSQANVTFKKAEDAEKLRKAQKFYIKGIALSVMKTETLTPRHPPVISEKEQKKPLPKKSGNASVSTPGAAKTTTSSTQSTTSSSSSGPKKTAAGKVVTKAKVLVSKAKNVSTKQTAKTVQTASLAAKNKAAEVKKALMQSGPKTLKNQVKAPGLGDSKQKPLLKQKPLPKQKLLSKKTSAGSKQPSAALKKTEKKPANKTETAKDVKPAKKKASAPRAETASAGGQPKAQAASPAVQEVKSESAERPAAEEPAVAEGDVCKVETEDSVSTTQTPQTQADAVVKVEEKDAVVVKIPASCAAPEKQQDELTAVKMEEAAVAPKDATGVTGTQSEAASDTQPQAELPKEDGGKIEPMELGDTEVAEMVKVETTAESPIDKEDLADESKESQTLSAAAAVPQEPQEPQEPPDPAQTLKAEVKDSCLTETDGTTESAPPEPERTAGPTGSSAEATSEAEPAAQTVQAQQKDVVTAAQTKTAPQSQPSSSDASSSIVREMIGKHLKVGRINFVAKHIVLSPRFLSQNSTVILVTQLPKYSDCCYMEKQLADLFAPFGFQYRDDHIFIAPQMRMAFIRMQTAKIVQNVMKAWTRKDFFLCKSKLCLRVVENNFSSPLEFYKCLMTWMNIKSVAHGLGTVYIKNMSLYQARELVEALKKIGSVASYIALLNRVFVQFDSAEDADRLGVWYSLLKQKSNHRVYRLLKPQSQRTLQPPRLLANAMLDSKTLTPGAAVVTASRVPEGSAAPFWLTLLMPPFLFPTASPWFVIPEFQTIKEQADIENIVHRDSSVYTVMITGLPEKSYTHQDVAQLVGGHLPKQNLHFLYYNVTVLPLQRRAFIHFHSWNACREFIQSQITSPFVVKDCPLVVHVVLLDMNPGFSEEAMYRSLMKWSNARVVAPDALEERLLAVEISEVSLRVIRAVVHEVMTVASVAGFLPLANRIFIEMDSPSGVTDVEGKSSSLGKLCAPQIWSKVERVESLKSLKKRRQDSSEALTALESKPEAPADPEKQSGPAASEAVPAEQLPEKLETDSSSSAKPHEDAKNAETSDEPRTTAASAADSSAAKSDDSASELLNMGEDVYRAIAAAVHEHRLNRQARMQSKGKEVFSKSSTSSSRGRKQGMRQARRQRRSRGHAAFQTFCFDDLNFNFEDFVTVDEIGADAEDTARDERRSSSRPSTSGRDNQHGSDTASPHRRTSSRSTRDSKSSPSSSSSSSHSKACHTPSKSSASSSSTSVSPRKHKHSPEATKSPIKPSSSSPGHKSQPADAKSPLRASHSSSSSLKSPSAKVPSAAAAAAEETSHSAVPKTDHRVSEESSSTQSVESDSKTETSEMPQPAEGQHPELKTQNQQKEAGLKEDTPSDVKEHKGPDRDKDEEEGDEPENYQILDSIDDEPEEQMDKDENPDGGSEIQTLGPELEQSVAEGGFRVLDSVGDEGPADAEGSSDVEMDAALQVQDKDSEDQEATSRLNPERGEGSTAELPTKEEASPVVSRTEKPADESQTLDTTDEDKNREKQRGEGNVSEQDNRASRSDEQLSDGQLSADRSGSVGDQTGAEDAGQKVEAFHNEIRGVDVKPSTEEEEDSFQVIDSVDELPTSSNTESETETRRRRTRRQDVTAKKDEGPTRRSGRRTRASDAEEKAKFPVKISSEMPTKDQQDQTVSESTEETVYEVVDSVEEEPVQDDERGRSGRRRTTRGSREKTTNQTQASEKPDGKNENKDTVEDEAIVPTRPTRGRRGKTPKMESSDETTKKDETPSRRRKTPVRSSQECSREKTPSTDSRSEAASTEDSKDEASYEILDSVEEEAVEDDPPAAGRKAKRGRPRKNVKAAQKQTATLKKNGRENKPELKDDDEEMYQVVDSVEEDEPESSKKSTFSKDHGGSETANAEVPKDVAEEEEEPTYEIVDSVEDEEENQVEELTSAEAPGRAGEEETKTDDKQRGPQTCETPNEEETPNTGGVEVRNGSEPESLSHSEEKKNPPQEEETAASSTLVSLDEVSEEEEDYPDDSAEEEELKRRQAAAKQRQEERRSRGRDEVEVDPQDLVTVDEVGADEGPDSDGELQTLVTLDEIVEEEQEEGRAELSQPGSRPLSPEGQSVKPRPSEAADEAAGDEEEHKDEVEATSESLKRKHVEETEEGASFVTVDEVGEDEAPPTRKRGRPKKRSRQKPAVRRSSRGQQESLTDSQEDSSVLQSEAGSVQSDTVQSDSGSAQSAVVQSESGSAQSVTVQSHSGSAQSDVVESDSGSTHSDMGRSEAGPAPFEPPDRLTVIVEEKEEETCSRAKRPASGKRLQQLAGPEAKRARSQSPSVDTQFKLPPFSPGNPLGQEFVAPKSGFFCNLCSIFYLTENKAKNIHCSSRKHYDNLQKYYEKLQQKPSAGSVSD